MNVEVLISTMNQVDDSLVKDMNITTDCLIINQITSDMSIHLNSEQINGNIKMLNFYEKGLSKSRNKAISNAKGDICIMADDDVFYNSNYGNIVLKAYEDNPDADIIAFKVPRIGGQFSKKFRNKKCKVNFLTCLKISSVEITFKRNSIIDNEIFFNEEFGAGSEKYSMGEENIFLYECLKKGLKIVYLPIELAKTNGDESSWFRGFTNKYFVDKGACYYAMSKKYFWLLILQFAIRKRKVFHNNSGVFKALKLMFSGAKTYKKLL